MTETQNNSTTVETMMGLFETIRLHNNKPAPSENLKALISGYISRLSDWYGRQHPQTDEDGALAVELLELLASGDFDQFLDEIGDMVEGDSELEPLARIPMMPAIFASEADLGEEEEVQGAL